MSEPIWGDNEWNLLFKANQNLQPFVSTNYQAPIWGDTRWNLLFKLGTNISNISGGGGGGTNSPTVVVAPSSLTDFSTLPGGILPTSGSYIAFDNDWIYTIKAGVDTTWQQTARGN